MSKLPIDKEYLQNQFAAYNTDIIDPQLQMLAENKADKSEVTVNFLKPTLETSTVNGITCTNNGDGTYTLDGTATAKTVFLIDNVTFSKGTYKLLCYFPNATQDIRGIFVGEIFHFDLGNGAVFRVYSEVTYGIHIVVESGDSFDNLVIKPMITTNLSATYDDFVPFTGTTGMLNGDVAEIQSDVAEMEKSNERKMDKENPTGTGAFSMNRKADTTVGAKSTTEGNNCEASGKNSHAEGNNTTASGMVSHSEGNQTIASGNYSHAEGFKTTASGNYSHAEGLQIKASGNSSHAEGLGTTASGDHSHAGGKSTVAGYRAQTVIGEYNNNKEINLFEVGNGTSNTARSNALELTRTGDLTIAGDFNFKDANGNTISLRDILNRLIALESK